MPSALAEDWKMKPKVPTCDDWKKFDPILHQAISAARAIAHEAGVPFYEIVEVEFDDKFKGPADWIWDDEKETARIKIKPDAEPEALAHEVGHSLFHRSPLHDRYNEDPKYGDRFCNAFRYVLYPGGGEFWGRNDNKYDATKLAAKLRTDAQIRCVPEKSDSPKLTKAFTTYFVDLCRRKRHSMLCERILDKEDI